MSQSPNESDRAPRTSPVRIRTFLVPLFGAALYYAVILMISGISMLVLGTQRYLSYTYRINTISMAVLVFFAILWVYVSGLLEGKKIYRNRPSSLMVLSGAVIALGLLGITVVYFYLIEKVFSGLSFIRDSLDQYEDLLRVDELTFPEKIAFGISLTLLVPVAEELIFRGIILQEFLSTMKPAAAVILTGAFFAVVHIQPIQVGYAFLCGVVISAVYVLSRSIFLTILLHGVYNFFGSVLQTVYPESENWFEVLEIIYLAAIALSVIAVIYLKKRVYGKPETEDNHAASFGE